MPMHRYSIYTDLYLDINNCRRGILKFKDWEAVQIPYTLLCGCSSLPASIQQPLVPRALALQTDPEE